MTSKERVIKTINHQEPDRVPTGEWGIDHDHVSKILGRHTYWRNRKDTTIALWEGRRDEAVESMKKDYAELIEKLEYDIAVVDIVPPKGYIHPDPPKKIDDGLWQDSCGRIYKYAASNDSISCVTPSPEKEELTDEDIANLYSKANLDQTCFEVIDYIADKFPDKAVLVRAIDIYDFLLEPFGGDYNHKIILPLIAPDEIKKTYQPALEYNKNIINHIKKKNALIAMQGHDFGMNSGCILSPNSIRDIFFPLIKMVNKEIENSGMYPFFHCCGNIWDILDDYVDAGYKGYQSIQSSAGMDIEKIKEKYGKDLTLWTGVQCETLVSGSMEDTKKEARSYLKTLMPGGGFIFGSTNSVQYGAKTDNYLKALEIVKNEGIYI